MPAARLIKLAFFSIAMAYLESSVVVYLRLVYYPEGFYFPLKLMPANVYLIELGRELSTIIMLAMVAYISGEKLPQRFFYFIFCFGVWDIFYYVWLKIFINWPLSFFDDDILFLIPIPWVGPVLAPVIISISLIIISAYSLFLQEKGVTLKVKKPHIILSSLAILIILFSFTIETFTSDLLKNPDPGFPWLIFATGVIIYTVAFIMFLRNSLKINSPQLT